MDDFSKPVFTARDRHPEINAIGSLAVIAVLLSFACVCWQFAKRQGWLGRDVECPPITLGNRVMLHRADRNDDTAISRPDQIARLTGFANAYRSCTDPATYTIPAPRTEVVFYRDSHYLGSLGVGSNFFFVACDKGRGVRSATSSELSEFSRLIDAAQ
jgi:hypothetical protein